MPIDTEGIVVLRMDIEQREIYVADISGNIYFYDIKDKVKPRLVQKVRAVEDDVHIIALEFLTGGISILVGDTSGQITQWFPVREARNISGAMDAVWTARALERIGDHARNICENIIYLVKVKMYATLVLNKWKKFFQIISPDQILFSIYRRR